MPTPTPSPNPDKPTTADGEPRVVGPGFHERVYEVVRSVPKGRVTTFGDVAGVLGSRRVARHVGWAVAGCVETAGAPVPWHRVVNGQGVPTCPSPGGDGPLQVERLRSEGIEMDAKGRVRDFKKLRFAF